VIEEVREVNSSADPLLLQPTVYLVDSQDGHHEYPVRDEVMEVSSAANPELLYAANCLPAGQPGWLVCVSSEDGGLAEQCDPILLQPVVYLMDSQDGQHEYPVRKEVQEVSS
jgi:hypothetical protein